MKKHLLFIAVCLLLIGSTIAQTTLTLQPDAAAGKDASVYSCVPCGYADGNSGNKRDFDAIAWTNNGNLSKARSLIQFNLSSIPVGATITNAKLSLYYNPESPEGGHVSSFFHPNSSYLQRITANWDEFTVTWNNQPASTTTHRVSLAKSTSSTQNYTNINVTVLVQDMVNNPSQSFGFLLRLQSETTFKKLIFASSDAYDASLHPKLVVTYTTPAAKIVLPVVNEQAELKINAPLISEIKITPLYYNGKVELAVNFKQAASAQLSVFDLSGKIILNRTVQLNEGINQIGCETSGWRKGIYLVVVKTQEGVVSKKILIE